MNNQPLRINYDLLKSFRMVLFYSDYKDHIDLVDRMKKKVSVNVKTTYPNDVKRLSANNS